MEYIWKNNQEGGDLYLQAGWMAQQARQDPHEAAPKFWGVLQGVDGRVGENWRWARPSCKWVHKK